MLFASFFQYQGTIYLSVCVSKAGIRSLHYKCYVSFEEIKQLVNKGIRELKSHFGYLLRLVLPLLPCDCEREMSEREDSQTNEANKAKLTKRRYG